MMPKIFLVALAVLLCAGCSNAMGPDEIELYQTDQTPGSTLPTGIRRTMPHYTPTTNGQEHEPQGTGV